jgi:hypothetical protein
MVLIAWRSEVTRSSSRECSRQIRDNPVQKNMRMGSSLVHVSHASRAELWLVPVRASSFEAAESTFNTGELLCSKIDSSDSGWGRHYYINDL